MNRARFALPFSFAVSHDRPLLSFTGPHRCKRANETALFGKRKRSMNFLFLWRTTSSLPLRVTGCAGKIGTHFRIFYEKFLQKNRNSKENHCRFSGTSYLNTSFNSLGFYVIYQKSVTPAERAVNKLQRGRFEAGWNLKASLCLALIGMSKHDNIEMQK